MTISLHYSYTLDSTNPTYIGERDFLLKVAENASLRLYGLGLGGSSSGLSVTLDSSTPKRPVKRRCEKGAA